MRSSALADYLRPDFTAIILRGNEKPSLKELGLTSVFHQERIFPSKDGVPLEWIEPGSIAVLDGYEFNESFVRLLRERSRVVLIDDLAADSFEVDLRINHAPLLRPNDFKGANQEGLCLGAEYALIQKEFIRARTDGDLRRRNGALLVAFGGSDPHNLTERITANVDKLRFESLIIVLGPFAKKRSEIKELIKKSKHKNIEMHLSPSSEKLAKLFSECQAAVLPASTISLEAASVGVGLACGFYIDNQQFIHRGLVESGAALDLGDYRETEETELFRKINQLSSHERCLQLLEKQRELFCHEYGKAPREAFRALFS